MFTRSRGTMVYLIFLMFLLFSRSVTAEDYPIPDHGSLHLTIPKAWRVSSQSTKQPPGVVLQVRPESGDAFNIQVTTVWLNEVALTRTTQESIRRQVDQNGRQLLPQAVEKSLSVQELRGAQALGYYYTLTDRAPAPGEFRFMTQGTVLVGQTLTTFTILFHSPNAPDVGQCLKILETATYAAK